jgi:hypothetical protein
LDYFYDLYYVIKDKDMMKAVQLPDSFVKGLIVNVNVSKGGKKSSKELKVCSVKARSILFIEVDRENRKNIFRKVNRKDIVEFRPTAICEITIRDSVLPDKWESNWDSIGSPSQMVQSYGRFAQAARPSLTNYSNYMKPSTTNSVAGFPMV